MTQRRTTSTARSRPRERSEADPRDRASPLGRDGVASDLRIAGEDRHPLDLCLADQHAVEWVGVDRRKASQREDRILRQVECADARTVACLADELLGSV